MYLKNAFLRVQQIAATPLSSYADRAFLSFDEGIPNRITALIPVLLISSVVLTSEDKAFVEYLALTRLVVALKFLLYKYRAY